MKDHVNKANASIDSGLDAEVAAFRALVSRNFDNSRVVSDTDTQMGSAQTAAGDRHDAAGSDGELVDSGIISDRPALPGSNIHLAPGEVKVLAECALSVLSASSDGSDTSAPLAQLMALTEAYVAMDENARHDMLDRLMKRGVSPTDMVQAVVPATARYMGELWASDKLSFADVTIGTARLQETVRTIGKRQIDVADADPETPAIMLVVPRIEQHTLGVFVVAEQFRRHGLRVHMTLGNNHAEVLRLVRANNFAMIGITASCRRTLASVRDLVKTIRTGVPRITSIVVGGPVTNSDLDIISMTGADFVTSDAEEALRLCEIETEERRKLES